MTDAATWQAIDSAKRMATTRPPTVWWRRSEGAAIGAVALIAYGTTGASWWQFAAFILVPDLAMVGYLAGPRAGALIYNLAHSYTLPVALSGAAMIAGFPMLLANALVWIAHISADRMLGYGFKLPEGFRHTDLGTL